MASSKIGKLSVQLGVQLAGFESDMKRASRIAKKESARMKKQMQAMTKAIAVGSVAAAGGLLTLVKVTANVGDQLDKMSKRLGVSVEFLSVYDHRAKLAGASLESVGTAVKKMQKSINDANNGLSTAIRGFDTLGISLDEINKLSPEEQFELVSKSLGELESQTEKTGTAMDIFGRAGSDLITLFAQTPAEIKKATDELERFGAKMTTAQAESGAAFNDALQSLSKNAQGFGNILAGAVTPALTEIITQFNDSTIRDADEDWQGLQTTISTMYGSVLLIQGAFKTLGQAIGLMAVKSVQAFDVASGGLDVFLKRVQRGGLIVAGLFNDTADAAQRDLSRQIEELEQKTSDLYSTFTDNSLDDSFLNDAIENFTVALEKIDKVKGSFSKANKSIKETEKPLKKLAKTTSETAKEMTKLGKSFDSVINSLLTPLESLDAQYKEQIETLEDWRDANFFNMEILAQANEFIDRATAAYDKNKKAIEGDTKAIEQQVTPYDDLISYMKEELELLNLKGDALRGAEAAQVLASQGVTLASEGLEEYLNKLKEYLLLQNQINSASNKQSFGQKLDGISSLISSLDNMHKAFQDMGRDFGKGMKALSTGLSSALNSLGGLLGKDLLGGKLGKAIGVVGLVGEIASFIDAISGGKLFGTDFAQESATNTFNVGQTGGTGSESTTNVRQRSFFRGRQWQTIINDLSDEAQQAITALFDNIINVFDASITLLGSDLTDIITGSFVQNFDAEGNLTSEIATVLGRTYRESFEQFSQRLLAENIIAVIDSVLPQVLRDVTTSFSHYDDESGGSFGGSVTSEQLVNEVSHLAEQFRNDATALLDFANFALQAVHDIQDGNALLESLTDTTAIVQELSNANESLIDAYTRISNSTLLFESSLEIIGQTLDLTRDEFIRFSVDITEAAGGLEQAAGLWQRYFNVFYDSQELLQQQLSSATSNRDDLLGGLGLDRNINTEQFREIFEDLLPTLSADAVVQWLEAADALGLVLDLEGQLVEARSELTDMLSDMREELVTDGMSDFTLALRKINNELQDNLATARRLGATERELAMIRRFAERQIQQAMQELENSIQSLSNSIFGSSLDNLTAGIESQLSSIEVQISLLEQQQDAAQQAAQAAIQAYNAQQAALERVADFAASLLTSNFSPLNPQEQLAIAQAQFEAAFEAAQGGDVNALGSLQGLAQTLLGLSQTNYASGQANTDIFNSVLAMLESLGIGGGFAENPADTVSPELQALYDLQSQYLLDLANAQSAADAQNMLLQEQALLDMLLELSAASGESIQELAERLGVPLDQLVSDLDVNLSDLNSTLHTGLGGIGGTGTGGGNAIDGLVLIYNANNPDNPIIGQINDNNFLALNHTIETEGNETQTEISNMRTAFDDLAIELRNLASGAAA